MRKKLSDKQLKAVNYIIQGMTDKEVGAEVGVSRETVNTWKNQNSYFKAELNKQRNSIIQESIDKRRSVINKAYKVIELYLDQQLEDEDIDIKNTIDLLRLYQIEKPTLEMDAKIIELEETKDKEFKKMMMF